MKTTMQFMRFILFAFVLSAFAVSCDDDEPLQQTETPITPTPEPEESLYPEKSMTFVVDGEEIPVGAAFCNNYEGYVLVTASPEKVESIGDMMKFIQVLVLPQSLNQDIDLKKEVLTINAWDGETEMPIQITSDMLESGTMRLNYDEASGEYTLLMAMTFTDGKKVGVNVSAIMSDPAPEEGNTITINNEQKPIRAQFYMDDGEGNVYLYFTSAGIYYFGEIEKAEDYFCIVLNEDDLTGNEFDITNTDKTFSIFYMNQRPGEESASMADNTALDGATGTVSVSRSASDPTQFTADIAVAFGDGNSVAVNFEGTCLSVDYVPDQPEVANEFSCFGATEAIKSILVDQSDAEIWHIYLTATPGLTTVDEFVADWAFHITAPAEAFDGEPAGFSSYKEILKFEYDGNTWQYPGTGTLIVSLDGDQLELDFTTYGDVEGHYSGTAVVVK